MGRLDFLSRHGAPGRCLEEQEDVPSEKMLRASIPEIAALITHGRKIDLWQISELNA